MNKRLLTLLVTGTAVTLGALSPKVHARDIDAEINNATAQLNDINTQKQAVNAQVEQLSNQLADVQSRISATKADQAATQSKLDSLQSEIAKLQQLISERNERLQEQARAVQVNGARSYVDLLLNADSFTDFVNRVGVAMDMMNANRQMMQEQARDKAQVEAKEAEQQDNLTKQQQQEAQLQGLQNEFSSTLEANKVTLANLSQEEVDALATRDGLVQEKERIAEEKRKADEEAAKAQKAAEEARAKMQEEAAAAIAAQAATPAAATTSTPTTQAAQAASQSKAQASAASSSQSASTAKSAAPAAIQSTPIVGGGNFAAPDPSFVAALNGGYFGQCTYYVYNRFAQLGAPIRTSVLGNAAEWPANAAAAGYSVSSTPRAGTAIVFQRGLGGADPVYGHVGFVERVNADGSLFISEMNVQGVNVISTRTIPASIASQATYINFGL